MSRGEAALVNRGAPDPAPAWLASSIGPPDGPARRPCRRRQVRPDASTSSAWPDPIFLRSSADWFSTVRGRLGFVMQENLLVYVTAGRAMSRFKHSLTDPTLGFSQTDLDTESGWTVGGGIEWKRSTSTWARKRTPTRSPALGSRMRCPHSEQLESGSLRAFLFESAQQPAAWSSSP
jgi:hypothetical protein